MFAGAAALAFGVFAFGQSGAAPETRALKLYNIHTKEHATIVFKRDGAYDKAGLEQLNRFLRDWRKDKPTKMDPHLFDLIWAVYRESGSNDYIHVVCGYRSPETNAALRKRSRGVASKSQHMVGKALDYWIPGVQLSRLREIGLRMQTGGVGYYPSSGSPFVHMDTGSVRMWPRMTRQQLAKVFPNGRTLYLPSSGGPLPGYDEALAAYKARKGSAPAPISVASVDVDTIEDPDAVPLPRVSPSRTARAMVAMADQPAGRKLKPGIVVLTPLTPIERLSAAHETGDVDFDAAFDGSSPAVPTALAASMAERDQTEHSVSTSLPIRPTAVVATVDVTRPLRAETITTAVFRADGSEGEASDPISGLLAYAPATESAPLKNPKIAKASAFGIPLPQVNPLRLASETAETEIETTAPIAVDEIYGRLAVFELTMTSLDTQGLRMWIAAQSTREKRYALLTMPDFSQVPRLLDKPEVAYAVGFTATPYIGLRTDHFAGPLVQPPEVVDLTRLAVVAAR